MLEKLGCGNRAQLAQLALLAPPIARPKLSSRKR